MSRAADFRAAIRRVGEIARLPGAGEFYASIQPDFSRDEPRSETGTDFPHSYTVFTETGGAANSLRESDSLIYRNERYFVTLIVTVYLSGEAVYRRGKVRRELKGGY